MTTNSKTNKATHVIVGIGASAGGLQALNDFFDNVPTASLYSYIVVQHLSPDHKSLMAELLRKNTKIPIEVIEKWRRDQSKLYLPHSTYKQSGDRRW